MEGSTFKDDKARLNHVIEEYPLRLAESYIRAGKPIDEEHPFCSVDLSNDGIQLQRGSSKTNLSVTSKWSLLPSSLNQADGQMITSHIHTGSGEDSFIIENLYNQPIREKISDPLVTAIETDSSGPGHPFTIRKTTAGGGKDDCSLAPVDLIYDRANPSAAPRLVGETQAIASSYPHSIAESIKDASGKEIAQAIEILQMDSVDPSILKSAQVFIKRTN